MFLAKAYYRKGDFEKSKDTLLSLLGLYPNVIPLKYNLALCLYQQADKLFGLETRRAAQTREAIKYLKHAQKLFNWVQSQYSTQFKFLCHRDLSNKELEDAQVEQYKEMMRAADEKVSIIMDMLQYSEAQLQ